MGVLVYRFRPRTRNCGSALENAETGEGGGGVQKAAGPELRSPPPPKKRKNGSQKCWENTYEVHLEVTRLERHAIFRKSISLDDVDCFEALKSHTYQ